MEKIKLTIVDLEKRALPGWSVVAANGFCMPLDQPLTMHELLCGRWGITVQYLERRIQTLFVNNSPVDDPETIKVNPGDTITLSGAMPGLLGAVLRKGGVLKEMRRSISADNHPTLSGTPDGWVTVKLFNLIISELRSLFLRQGIVLTAEQAFNFLTTLSTTLTATDYRIWLDNQPVATAALRNVIKTKGLIQLTVSEQS